MSNSYKKIIKTTGVVGAVQVIKLFFGLIRNKLIAYLFGPAGLGVWSLYLSFTEMIQSVSSLGLEKSSVKQIAQNHENQYQRNLTIQVAQFSLIIFSLICTVIVAIFSAEFSKNLFGTTDFKLGILVCCLVVFINSLASVYSSILNGLSEIKALAISQLIGILVGNIIVFSLLPFFKLNAVPFYLLIIAISALLPTYLSVRKLKIPLVKASLVEIFQNLSMLMKVGFAFWFSAMFMTFITYLINIYLKDNFSIEVVGIYQASWTISNLYVGIILSSMGVAFFPKICRTINNKKESISIINEQIEFGLLVSLPFIIGIFIFAPMILTILYSSEFADGASIIRWQMLGVTIRLLGFPFGYVLMAKGKSVQYILAQFLFNGLNYGFMIWVIFTLGFAGLGINYLFAYIIYGVIVGFLCYRGIGYKFSDFLVKIIVIYIALFACATAALYFFDSRTLYVSGACIVLTAAYYAYYQLVQKLNIDIIGYVKGKIKK